MKKIIGFCTALSLVSALGVTNCLAATPSLSDFGASMGVINNAEGEFYIKIREGTVHQISVVAPIVIDLVVAPDPNGGDINQVAIGKGVKEVNAEGQEVKTGYFIKNASKPGSKNVSLDKIKITANTATNGDSAFNSKPWKLVNKSTIGTESNNPRAICLYANNKSDNPLLMTENEAGLVFGNEVKSIAPDTAVDLTFAGIGSRAKITKDDLAAEDAATTGQDETQKFVESMKVVFTFSTVD